MWGKNHIQYFLLSLNIMNRYLQTYLDPVISCLFTFLITPHNLLQVHLKHTLGQGIRLGSKDNGATFFLKWPFHFFDNSILHDNFFSLYQTLTIWKVQTYFEPRLKRTPQYFTINSAFYKQMNKLDTVKIAECTQNGFAGHHYLRLGTKKGQGNF